MTILTGLNFFPNPFCTTLSSHQGRHDVRGIVIVVNELKQLNTVILNEIMITS